MSNRKRPTGLSLDVPQQPPPAANAVTITDTLTLVVKRDGGVEMRVKESGVLGPQAPASAHETSPAANEAVLNKIRFEDLRIGPELGKGSQGKVRIVQHRQTQEKFALKYLTFEGDAESQRILLQSELTQVEALKHENVVSSYEAFFRDGKVYIVLEYMDCGTMKDIMKRHPSGIDESKLAYIARELLKGLQYLHTSKVVHRDLKPANVLANSKGEVKISDFGVAKRFSGPEEQTLTSVGSVSYLSPERIQAQPYSFSCDVWSAGVTLAELALGQYPFRSRNMYELCQILTSTVRINWEESPKVFSDELKEFIALTLTPASARPSAEDLLKHPFIKRADDVKRSEMGIWFATTDAPTPTTETK
eukprot:CAMPEP_0176430624 /NCGR_PEP_ID=MMETSP0127-20121128/14356_1 /TAXON_ID=938130 /ORGANISM="Platyophrya macrostoma, Strain WH" /LENGTH=362 /DNA_ID=CAMNT_0017812533 /DNA_START=53 /DNA_END=1141 /DNA_ORIENTATION=-